MAETKQVPYPVTLEINRIVPFSREHVFDAFAEQKHLNQWLCRDASDHVIEYLKFDFRVGAGIEMKITTGNGVVYMLHMTYREIKRPSKIAFTWGHEQTLADGKPGRDTLAGTLVTFDFNELPGATEIVLTHQLLPSEKEFNDHKQGWMGCLDKLSQVLEHSENS